MLDLTLRKYGTPPYRVAVLHGGPGAPGYMARVARELSKLTGILEPLQTRSTVRAQINELREQMLEHAQSPVTLIGSSWGAVLALLLAATNDSLVQKLILIGCAVFDAENSAKIDPIRMARLDDLSRQRYYIIKELIKTSSPDRQSALFEEWGEIYSRADMFDPLTTDLEVLEVQSEINNSVWSDFKTMRDKPAYLNNLFSKIKAPVVVIHGSYDPHPLEGIRPFLESCIINIKFHILPNCGHYPWIERQAADQFYKIIKAELETE